MWGGTTEWLLLILIFASEGHPQGPSFQTERIEFASEALCKAAQVQVEAPFLRELTVALRGERQLTLENLKIIMGATKLKTWCLRVRE
jgi:hypothetical protein